MKDNFLGHLHIFVILQIFASNFFFVRGILLILFFHRLKIVYTVFLWVMGKLDFPRALLQEKIKWQEKFCLFKFNFSKFFHRHFFLLLAIFWFFSRWMFWFSQGRKIIRAKARAGTFKKHYIIMRVLVPLRSWQRNMVRLRVGIRVKKLRMVHIRVRLYLPLLYRCNYCTQICVMLQVMKQDGGWCECGYCKNHPFYHEILYDSN